MAAVFEGRKTFMSRLCAPVESTLYKLCGIDEKEEMGFMDYMKAMLWFNFFGFIFVLILQMVQKYLPLNPYHLPNVGWDLSFNTAMSFMTNTNWQAYSGESTLSYLTQMIGLCVQNFVSAATGIAVFLAFTRGLINRSASSLG